MSGPWMAWPVSLMSSTSADDDNAVAAEKLTLAQDEIAHVAHALAVHKDGIGGDTLSSSRMASGDWGSGSPSSRMNVRSGRDAPITGQVAVLDQVAVLAVDRHERSLGRTASSMVRSSSRRPWPETCTGRVPSWHTSAPMRYICVDQPIDGPRIAGNDAGGHDHRVALHDGKLAVLAGCDAGKRGQGLTLRSGGDDHHALGGNARG